jgi:hypothetical protein
VAGELVAGLVGALRVVFATFAKSPIESTYRNDNLLHYPEAYQRLQETVKPDPRLTLLETNTDFTII